MMGHARQVGKKRPGTRPCEEPTENREQTTTNWLSIHDMLYEVTIDGKNHRLEVDRADGGWQCRLDGLLVKVDAVLNRRNVLSLLMNGKAYDIKRELTTTGMNIWVGTTRYAAQIRDPRSLRRRKDGAGDDLSPKELVAPMPGKVVRILVSEMMEVEAGQGIVIVEAMKMQNEIKSPRKGIVQKLLTAEGANVNAGDVLAIVE
jgi:biotin carboxyl carrier protein